MLQRPKVSKDKEIPKDDGNDDGNDIFSTSRRWENVRTGHVKNRANIYMKPDESQNSQSPKKNRKLLKPRTWFKKDQDNINNNLETSNINIEKDMFQKLEQSKTPNPLKRTG